MASRLELQSKLEEILGSKHVYYQPPENLKMRYPCMVYEQYTAYNPHANDRTYLYMPGYQVTVIDADPDSGLKDRMINSFSMCRWSRHFVSDNLNHDVFIVYY
jgi:hypothetical protein